MWSLFDSLTTLFMSLPYITPPATPDNEVVMPVDIVDEKQDRWRSMRRISGPSVPVQGLPVHKSST